MTEDNSDSSSQKPPEKHGENMRRNSTGKLNLSGSRPIPHYRIASTGSCHDICKYGKAHTFEEKAKGTAPWQKAVPKCGGQIWSRRVSLPSMNTAENATKSSRFPFTRTPLSDGNGRNKVETSHQYRNRHISPKKYSNCRVAAKHVLCAELHKLPTSVLKPPLSDNANLRPSQSLNGEISVEEGTPGIPVINLTLDSEPKSSSSSSETETDNVHALIGSLDAEISLKSFSDSDSRTKCAVKDGRDSPKLASINEKESSKIARSHHTERSNITEESISRKNRRPLLRNSPASVGSPKLKNPINSVAYSKLASPSSFGRDLIKESGCSSRINTVKEIPSPGTFKCSTSRRNRGVDSPRNDSGKKLPSPSEPLLRSIMGRKTASNSNYTTNLPKTKPRRCIEGKEKRGVIVLTPSIVVSSLKKTQSFGSRNKRSFRVALVMKSPKKTKKIEHTKENINRGHETSKVGNKSRAIPPMTNSKSSRHELKKHDIGEKLLCLKKRSPSSPSHLRSATSGFQNEDGCHSSGSAAGNRHVSKEKTLKTFSGLANGKRKPKTFVPRNEECEPTKVKFRRGKVIDTPPDTIRAPRRLKFRQARLLADKKGLVTNGRKQSFKRADEAISRGHDGADEHEKVVLRHQDMLEGDKRDAQGLLNMVIEETASKLVVSRKSKVKALVGAFETVISLQEAARSPLNTMVL